MKPKHSHVEHFFAAFGYSMQGLKFAWQNESSFKQEVILACLLIPAAFFISNSTLETFFLIFLVFIVLAIELLNSAVEAIIDRIGEDLQDMHPLSGAAKDMGSAAIFLLSSFTGFCYAYLCVKNLL